VLGTSSCSAFVAAVVAASTSVVGGQALPSGTAYSVIYLAATGAALLATVIAALTPRPVPAAEESAATAPPAARAA
jgi:hypothetical protein